MTSRRARIASWLAVAVGLGVALAACGKKGPPLAPLRPVPAAVTTLAVRRLGDTVRLTFTVPTANVDRSTPADLERIEVYGLTIDPAGDDPDIDEFIAGGMLVARIDVKPPAPTPEEGAAPPAAAPAPPPDPRPGQGDEVSVEETLTAEERTPVLIGTVRERPPASPRALAALEPVPEYQERTYLAIAISHRDRRSASSPRVTVSLGPMPPPPAGFAVAYTESDFVVSWDPGPPDPWQPIWPLFKFLRGVDVYEVAGAGVVSPAPLDAAPVTAAIFELPLESFGEPRCFAARTTESIGPRVWSGALTAPVCVTPEDTFAPAAPTGLEAVSSGGVISLIWDANDERDLAGYLVLRAEAPGDTLRAVTAAPIRDTTYRDTDVRPGVRYVYAVVALDNASPPNISEQSARADEVAR